MPVTPGLAGSPGARQALCIALVDVDHFKQYNDLYGHPAGDAALRRVAVALRDAARHSDLAARYGGEEFAVVLPDTPDPVPVLDKFMGAIAALEIPHRGSPTGRLTISCGAVAALRTSLTMAQLFKAADEALYEAKSGGRSRYVVRSAAGR